VSQESVERIRQAFQRSPKKSTRRASAELQLPRNIDELKIRIRQAVETVTVDMLDRVWRELDYRLDTCRVTRGVHIEHL
jgi:hypothetical protein